MKTGASNPCMIFNLNLAKQMFKAKELKSLIFISQNLPILSLYLLSLKQILYINKADKYNISNIGKL